MNKTGFLKTASPRVCTCSDKSFRLCSTRQKPELPTVSLVSLPPHVSLCSARLSTANAIKTAQVPDPFQLVDAALLCFAKTPCQRMFDVRIQRRLTDARWCSLIHSMHFSIAFKQPQVAAGLERGMGWGLGVRRWS